LKCEDFKSNKSIRLINRNYSSINLNKNDSEIFKIESINKTNITKKIIKFKKSGNDLIDKINRIERNNKINNLNNGRNNNKPKKITRDRNRLITVKNILKNKAIQADLAKNSFSKNKKITINFGICFTLAKKILGSCYKPKDKNVIFDFIERYVNGRLDVTYYLKTLEKFDRVRVILFNYYQNLLLDYTKIPNLRNRQELINLDLDLNKNEEISNEELANYFNFRIKNDELDEYDEQLLKIVLPEIRNKVSYKE
jgi:hypothetical protein